MSDAATLLASGIAAGRCQPYCNSSAKSSFRSWCYSCAIRGCSWRFLNGLYQLREELVCRSYRRASCEAAQSRSSPDKWLLREEVAGRRGASAKKCEEVRQRRSNPAKKSSSLINPSMHPTHPSIHSFVHSFSH